MNHQRRTFLNLSLIILVGGLTQVAFGLSKAKEKPLEDRVRDAKTIFVGKLINKVVEGDWVTAELLVETPLKDAKEAEKIKVTWRWQIGGQKLYDTLEGSRGIAILDAQREGAYWLRDDKFVHIGKLKEVEGFIKGLKKK